MKKVVLVLVAGISLATAKAQIQYGIKAGANFATISGSDANGAKSITNFNGGVFVKLPLASQFSLQPEVLYSGQGAKADNGQGDVAKLNLGYLNIPVLVKYSLPAGLFVQTGPQIGFLMSATAKLNGVSEPNAKDNYKSTDVSWDFGAGYVSPFNLGIEARYGLGLTKIGKSEGGDPAANIKNSVFSVGLFYLFGSAKGGK